MINALKFLSLIARVNFIPHQLHLLCKNFPKGLFNKLIDCHPHKKQARQENSIIPHKLVIARIRSQPTTIFICIATAFFFYFAFVM
jgi:hypothetical protein